MISILPFCNNTWQRESILWISCKEIWKTAKRGEISITNSICPSQPICSSSRPKANLSTLSSTNSKLIWTISASLNSWPSRMKNCRILSPKTLCNSTSTSNWYSKWDKKWKKSWFHPSWSTEDWRRIWKQWRNKMNKKGKPEVNKKWLKII